MLRKATPWQRRNEKLIKEDLMARSYDMAVLVERHRPEAADAIKQAVEDQWGLECVIEAWSSPADGALEAFGCCCLDANDSPADFAARLAEDVWMANQEYCEIWLVVLVPGRWADRSTTYRTTRDDYQAWSRTRDLPYIRGTPGRNSPLPRAAYHC